MCVCFQLKSKLQTNTHAVVGELRSSDLAEGSSRHLTPETRDPRAAWAEVNPGSLGLGSLQSTCWPHAHRWRRHNWAIIDLISITTKPNSLTNISTRTGTQRGGGEGRERKRETEGEGRERREACVWHTCDRKCIHCGLNWIEKVNKTLPWTRKVLRNNGNGMKRAKGRG